MGKRSEGLSLIELLVSIVIFSIIMVSLTIISSFSYRHVIDASRKSDLQQQASFIVEHLSKNIKRAIGSPVLPGLLTNGNFVVFRVDRNFNGKPDDDASGQWKGYNYIPGTYTVEYFTNCDRPGTWPTAGTGEVLSSKITGFSLIPQNPTNAFYVSVLVTACYDPDGSPYACGTRNNPSVTVSTNLDTPALSAR